MHLAQLGILAPRDVSLIGLDPNPAFAWCKPSIAHFHWEGSLLVRRITRWADKVSRGIDDRRMSSTKAEFIEGGTVGPAPTGAVTDALLPDLSSEVDEKLPLLLIDRNITEGDLE